MKRFKLLNNIFGWVAFAIAAVTYLLTLEPTASFWDCGEFISTAFKLDVGHPPGAPFFMLTGHFFSLFASDPTQVALMVNAMSGILSALTILFLFWTITHIARKVIINDESDYTVGNIIAILGAGMVGALAFTFSDSFWYSAVEGEVYAYSSFFTAVVFWMILKWERVADREGSDRWLILIAYLMGLSIGVHLLNLLAIPALVLVYYFKKYNPSTKGVALALMASGAILVAVLYGIIPGFVEVASWFELFFVNTVGMPFNSGLYIYIISTIAVLSWAIYESYVNKSPVRLAVSFILAVAIVGIPFIGESVLLGSIIILGMAAFFYYMKARINPRWINTILLMITVLLIGYSSYAVIVIRSSAQPTMDQNSPENVFNLKYYLNREQYGDRPLFYGATFNAPVKLRVEGNMCVPEQEEGAKTYAAKPKNSPSDKDQYIVTGTKTDYIMDERFMMLFPRMYSPDPRHIQQYKQWGQISGKTIDFEYCGQQRSEIKPTFGENLRFFFEYQVNFMYWRYFFWNFSGRQNDIQGSGEFENGNWITGIGFIDNLLVGDQSKLPTELRENKGRNVYYMLPFILGLIGVLYLLLAGKKGKESFWIVGLLFVLTGLAIVVYLNQTPLQPRERDYAYTGSFYAFAIFIGLGVLGIIRGLDKWVPRSISAILVSLVCLGVPALMAQQNWDDHDRSGRYTCRDFGSNYLQSCKENAIIFTNGDNDTFPVWYNQEVEGNRTDVRVCNLSYLQTDWYIDQMKRGAYKSAPLPISWQPKDYIAGKNEVLWVDSIISDLDVKTTFDYFILNDDPKTKNSDNESFLPTSHLYLPVDAKQVISSGTVPLARAAEIAPKIDIKVNRRLTKSELMILEMLKENNWKRPIYFAVTIGQDGFMNLNDHFELTGLAYQVTPTGVVGAGERVNVDEMYNNMMTKFKFGGIENPKVYLDENILRMCTTHRSMFAQLIATLINKGDNVRAKKALDYCLKVIPAPKIRHDYFSISLAESAFKLGDSKTANAILDAVAHDCVEYLDWYFSMDSQRQASAINSIGQRISIMNKVLSVFDENQQKALLDKYAAKYMDYSRRIQM